MRALLVVCALSTSALAGSPASTEATARRYFDAFARRDAATMGGLYAPHARFHDPVFGKLDAKRTARMWSKTIGSNETAKIAYRLERADDHLAVVHWDAQYTLFGRPVVNHATSYLHIEDGAITRQNDVYSWAAWSRQALPIGPLSKSNLVHRVLSSLFRLTLR